MRVGCDSIVLLMGTYNPEDAHLIKVRVGKRQGATKNYNGITRGRNTLHVCSMATPGP